MLVVSAICPECGEPGPDVDEEFGEHDCESCGCTYRWEVIVDCDVVMSSNGDVVTQ